MSGHPSGNTTLVANDFFCRVHNPPALYDRAGLAHGLPPSAPREGYLVDEFPACPGTWNRSDRDGRLRSYFVPMREEGGMWLDFTRNANKDHDVAVVISVQGVNALTIGETKGIALEQYRRCCPIHSVPFANADRLCRSCGFNWPAQNYIATTTGQYLWLDGFRLPNGETRQFVITTNADRGIGSQVLGGSANTPSAIGIAFYESVHPKPRPMYATRGGGLESTQESCFESTSVPKTHVAAGARINQDVGVDPKDISYWRDQPSALMLIEVPIDTAVEHIFRQSRPQSSGNPDGALAGLRIGNNPFGTRG